MAFYYPWYGNPATDGRYANWNHPVAVRNEPPRSYPGGDDIGSNFYPSLGCYSVNDPKVLREFGASPACQRLRNHENKPVFFVYDSYLRPASEWATVLRKEGTNSIRGSEADAVVLGLWVKPDEERFMLEGGFDGFYTYFATDGFTFGSTVSHWPKLADWARAHGKLFVPCVAPGYIDTRIRPWNGVKTRDREAGAYYDRMWSAALKVSPELVGITSFNEWHEGTQIETAVPKQIPGFSYLNYQRLTSDYYLDRTAQWIRRMNSK